MKFIHAGMPVGEQMEGMTYLEPLKVWVKNEPEYQVEFLYFEVESPMAAAIQELPHVAFEVEDIDAALVGKAVLWPKFDLGGAYIAFVFDKDVVVEFYQPKK